MEVNIMRIVGITGQTGSGKSAVCKLLSEKYGYFHIDADIVGKNVINGNTDILKALRDVFGKDVIFPNGKLDRKVLAQKAFKDEKSTELLNSITHPAITAKICGMINAQRIIGTAAVMIDAIALFESGEDEICDFTVATIAPRSIRLKRILKRDNLTEEQALLRINAQKSDDFYKEKATIIINNYPPFKLEDEVSKIIGYE